MYVWQLVSGLKGEQTPALNEATIWYEKWLIISGICKGTWILKLKVFTCYFIPPYFRPQQTAPLHIWQLQASKHPLMCCSDRKCKVKVSLYKQVQLQLNSLLSSALHWNECSPSHPWHSIPPKEHRYLYLCGAGQYNCLIKYWFIILIIDYFVSRKTDMTHRKFYSQHPTAVSSADSSNSHKPTSSPHSAW